MVRKKPCPSTHCLFCSSKFYFKFGAFLHGKGIIDAKNNWVPFAGQTFAGRVISGKKIKKSQISSVVVCQGFGKGVKTLIFKQNIWAICEELLKN